MCGARGVAQHPEEPVRLAQVVAESAEVQQTEIRIGSLGEPGEHHRQQVALDLRAPRDPTGERGDVVQGAPRIVESDGREPRLRLLAGEDVAVVGKGRHG